MLSPMEKLVSPEEPPILKLGCPFQRIYLAIALIMVYVKIKETVRT